MNPKSVYLVQADTTVGFSSNDREKLAIIKKRPLSQKILSTVNNFKTLKKHTRVPKKFKNRVRRSRNTTFIYPNGNSYRKISSKTRFYDFLDKFDILYSSSANVTKQSFEKEFAFENADVIVFTKDGFYEDTPSTIIKINNKKAKKLR